MSPSYCDCLLTECPFWPHRLHDGSSKNLIAHKVVSCKNIQRERERGQSSLLCTSRLSWDCPGVYPVAAKQPYEPLWGKRTFIPFPHCKDHAALLGGWELGAKVTTSPSSAPSSPPRNTFLPCPERPHPRRAASSLLTSHWSSFQDAHGPMPAAMAYHWH